MYLSAILVITTAGLAFLLASILSLPFQIAIKTCFLLHITEPRLNNRSVILSMVLGICIGKLIGEVIQAEEIPIYLSAILSFIGMYTMIVDINLGILCIYLLNALRGISFPQYICTILLSYTLYSLLKRLFRFESEVDSTYHKNLKRIYTIHLSVLDSFALSYDEFKAKTSRIDLDILAHGITGLKNLLLNTSFSQEYIGYNRSLLDTLTSFLMYYESYYLVNLSPSIREANAAKIKQLYLKSEAKYRKIFYSDDRQSLTYPSKKFAQYIKKIAGIWI